MTRVVGRPALVTGAGSGIGRGLVIELARRGARVVAADIDRDAAEESARSVGGVGYGCDVADPDAVEDLARRLASEVGVVELLACNAGVGPGAPVAEMTPEDWSWLIGVNLWGVLNPLQAFLPGIRTNGGHVLVTSSMAAFAPNPPLGGYAATKAAVTAMAEVLAAELAASDPAVGVTILAPGPTRSAIGTSLRHRNEGARGGLVDIDLERQGYDWIQWREPSEVARTALDAIEADRLYAFSHPELRDRVRERARRIEAALGAAASTDQPTRRPPST
jgi:NAD(P)-dependent dehydrogenase (short-subunit alcohol dehydrogenase family)